MFFTRAAPANHVNVLERGVVRELVPMSWKRALASSQTLNCICSAGNQLFAEGLRSVLVCSDPSGGFPGLCVKQFGDDGRFVVNPLFNLSESNTDDIERGGVQFKAGAILFLLKVKEWLLSAEFGLVLEIVSSM